jgi:molecular chaperone GrpE
VADEYDIPVKVVDRRWWAKSGETSDDRESPGGSSLKPTYVEELEKQVAEKDRLAQEYIVKYRQAASEFEEARLRLRREIAKDVERARRDVLAELLEVVDNLDRAVDAAGPTASLESVIQGVDMVRRQFLAKLEGLGVTRVDAAGEPFDPQVHEAVTMVPAASEAEDGVVLGVIRHGYRIGGEVLRPASVAVGKRSESPEP